MIVWTQDPTARSGDGESVERWTGHLPNGAWPVASIQGPTHHNSRYRVLIDLRWKNGETRDVSTLEAAHEAAEDMIATHLAKLGVHPT